jgi:hypothetical protein
VKDKEIAELAKKLNELQLVKIDSAKLAQELEQTKALLKDKEDVIKILAQNSKPREDSND